MDYKATDVNADDHVLTTVHVTLGRKFFSQISTVYDKRKYVCGTTMEQPNGISLR